MDKLTKLCRDYLEIFLFDGFKKAGIHLEIVECLMELKEPECRGKVNKKPAYFKSKLELHTITQEVTGKLVETIGYPEDCMVRGIYGIPIKRTEIKRNAVEYAPKLKKELLKCLKGGE